MAFEGPFAPIGGDDDGYFGTGARYGRPDPLFRASMPDVPPLSPIFSGPTPAARPAGTGGSASIYDVLALLRTLAGMPPTQSFGARTYANAGDSYSLLNQLALAAASRAKLGQEPPDDRVDPTTVQAAQQFQSRGVHAPTALERSRVVFGETSGLYPHSIDPTKSERDPTNWETDSADNLAAARRYVGVVAGRNPQTHAAGPHLSNPLEAAAWHDAQSAGTAAHRNPNLLDPRIDRFFIRGEGIAKNPWPNKKRYLTIGPFRNVGGGDAPAGNNTYIEFYGDE